MKDVVFESCKFFLVIVVATLISWGGVTVLKAVTKDTGRDPVQEIRGKR